LSKKALRSLERLGVNTRLRHTVINLDDRSVTLMTPGEPPDRIRARTVVWAAGVVAADVAGVLANRAGPEVDRAGRIGVGPDLSLPGHPEVLALGDMARVHTDDGSELPLPGTAPVAMQQGRYAARVVRDRLLGRSSPPFRYRDRGNLATIGRVSAVAEVGRLRLGGLVAWITWLAVHLWYLTGFQNRLIVLIRWAVSFVTHGRGARLITRGGQVGEAGQRRASSASVRDPAAG
jgi:NADH dehydrogenase